MRSFFAASKYRKHYDPFSAQKVGAFRSSAAAINQLSMAVEGLMVKAGLLGQDGTKRQAHDGADMQALKVIFRELVQTSLWGNATDLSLLTHLTHADIQQLQAGGVGAEAQSKREHFILSGLQGVDQAWNAVVEAGPSTHVDIILDNSGFELFTDLLLADFLLASGLVAKVRFHPKDMPWFVSDVTPADFLFTIEALQSGTAFFSSEVGETSNGAMPKQGSGGSTLDKSYFLNAQSRSVSPSRSYVVDSASVLNEPITGGTETNDATTATQRLATRWSQYLQAGVFELSIPATVPLGGSPDLERTSQANFWTSHHNYPSLPLAAPKLFAELQKSALIISKGDLNYRKWCSDAQWSFSEPFQNVLGPVTSKLNLLVLRTNKADVCVGVPIERLATLDDEDPKWRTNGRYAMVEYVGKE